MAKVWRALMERFARDGEAVLRKIVHERRLCRMSAVLRSQAGSGLHVQLIITPLDAEQTAAMMAAPTEAGEA
jgi:hypothetical protein